MTSQPSLTLVTHDHKHMHVYDQHHMWYRQGEWNETSYAHAHEYLDDACAHEMQVPNACLTLECYSNTRNIR